MDYAGDMGARVANGSFSFTGFTDAAARQMLSDAVTSHPETLYVFAAGNGGRRTCIGDDLDAGDTGDEQHPPVRADRRERGLRRGHRPGRPAGRVLELRRHLGRPRRAPGWTCSATGRASTYFTPTDAPRAAASTSSGPAATRGTWGRTTAAPFAGPDGGGIADSPAGNYRRHPRQHRHSAAVVRRSGRGHQMSARVQPPDRARRRATPRRLEILRDGTPVTTAITYTPGNNGSRQHLPGRRCRSTVAAATYQVTLTRPPRPTPPARPTASTFGGMHSRLRRRRRASPAATPVHQRHSMATPHVAGAAALLLAAKPALSVAQLRTALLDHGRSGGGADGQDRHGPQAQRGQCDGAPCSAPPSGGLGDGRVRPGSGAGYLAGPVAGSGRGRAWHLQPGRAARLAAARRLRGRSPSP